MSLISQNAYSHRRHHKGNQWWNKDSKLNLPKSRLAYYHEESFLITDLIFFTTTIKVRKNAGKCQPSLKLQKANFLVFRPRSKRLHIAFLQPAVKALKWDYFCPELLWIYHLQRGKGSVASRSSHTNGLVLPLAKFHWISTTVQWGQYCSLNIKYVEKSQSKMYSVQKQVSPCPTMLNV